MTTNEYKTSDIKLTKDSQGYFTADHKNQGELYEHCYFGTRAEARRAAVEELNEIKENGKSDFDEWSNEY
tara:strand:+ start:217 stop:426 length:210 start_codon:yes stop_codon:yes gene_type:complete